MLTITPPMQLIVCMCMNKKEDFIVVINLTCTFIVFILSTFFSISSTSPSSLCLSDLYLCRFLSFLPEIDIYIELKLLPDYSWKPTTIKTETSFNEHFVDDVVISVLAWSVVDCGFEQHEGVRGKSGWLSIRIMCPSRVTGLPADFCLCELVI